LALRKAEQARQAAIARSARNTARLSLAVSMLTFLYTVRDSIARIFLDALQALQRALS
jgi:hypothetical protein